MGWIGLAIVLAPGALPGALSDPSAGGGAGTKCEANCAAALTHAETAVRLGADPVLTRYSVARWSATMGCRDEAFRCLDTALSAGWRDTEAFTREPAFLTLHDDPRWMRIVDRCIEATMRRLNHEPLPVLREELLRRMQEDQRIRTTVASPSWEWWKVDADNLTFMKKVVDKYGWPDRRLVGDDGAGAAWLLVQHASSDLAFQRKCLTLLEAAVERNDASREHLAYLSDRVLVLEGKPQRYGTQFQNAKGSLKPFPIEDEANVDARRASMGLEPMAEYAETLRQVEQPRRE